MATNLTEIKYLRFLSAEITEEKPVSELSAYNWGTENCHSIDGSNNFSPWFPII
jgi:hypothetical protein